MFLRLEIILRKLLNGIILAAVGPESAASIGGKGIFRWKITGISWNVHIILLRHRQIPMKCFVRSVLDNYSVSVIIIPFPPNTAAYRVRIFPGGWEIPFHAGDVQSYNLKKETFRDIA